MDMKQMIEELRLKRASSLDDARPHAVEKQRSLGKMTARQRLDLLIDSGTFLELGQLAEATSVTEKESPADGVIIGVGKVDGRQVAVLAFDFTVMGGSQDKVSHQKTDHIHKIALEQSIPIIYLLEGSGQRAQDIEAFEYYVPEMWFEQVRMSGWVPMIAAVMGPCYAGHAIFPGLSDFVIMVEETSSLGIAGTHLVRSSISQDVEHTELGNAKMHAEISGVADLAVKNEKECITKIKEFLSFLPSRASESPLIISCDDPVDRREEKLIDIIPMSPKRMYDMYHVIHAIVDHGYIFDIKANWAKNMITCLARMNGCPVGIIANQPMYKAGIVDVYAAEKYAHFVEFCDAFNIPIIFLADVPGFMVGHESERTGLVRRGMKTLYALGNCTVPVLSVVIRKSYGLGGYIMGSRGTRTNHILAWPSAQMGAMGLEGAVEILHRKQIAESEDPEKLKAELVEKLLSKLKALPTAKVFGFDDVIDPRDTRPVLIRSLESFSRKNLNFPPKKHGIAPI
jgi:acetyl-CoA carboxylase carboxyltransferase component